MKRALLEISSVPFERRLPTAEEHHRLESSVGWEHTSKRGEAAGCVGLFATGESQERCERNELRAGDMTGVFRVVQ